MDTNELGRKVLDTALETVQQAQNLGEEANIPIKTELVVGESEHQTEGVEKTEQLCDGSGGNEITDSFASLPMESLICASIVAAARGQQALTEIYIEGVKRLAYEDGDSGTSSFPCSCSGVYHGRVDR